MHTTIIDPTPAKIVESLRTAFPSEWREEFASIVLARLDAVGVSADMCDRFAVAHVWIWGKGWCGRLSAQIVLDGDTYCPESIEIFLEN